MSSPLPASQLFNHIYLNYFDGQKLRIIVSKLGPINKFL